MTIAICVEEGHELVGLIAGDRELDLTESRVELVGVNLVVAIEGVEVSEGSSETSDCLSTTSLDLSSYSLEN